MSEAVRRVGSSRGESRGLLSLTATDRQSINRMLAAVLHLGNIVFTQVRPSVSPPPSH
jgi:hypothetical protein